MQEDPLLDGTCAGMVPGGGISDEERRKRDLSYKPARLQDKAETKAADEPDVDNG